MGTHKAPPVIQTKILLKMLATEAPSFYFRTFDDVVLEDGKKRAFPELARKHNGNID